MQEMLQEKNCFPKTLVCYVSHHFFPYHFPPYSICKDLAKNAVLASRVDLITCTLLSTFMVWFPLSLYHCALQDFTFYDGLPPRRHISTVFFHIAVLAVTAIVRAIVKVKFQVSFPIPCSQHLQSFLPSCVGHLHPKWMLSTQGSIMKELDVKLVTRSCTL